MKATIIPSDSGISPSFMIVFTDDAGQVFERITVEGVFITGTPHPKFEIDPKTNLMRLVR